MDEKALNLALGYLARRPHSEKEVRDYLRKKMVGEDRIGVVVDRLKELKFLNDVEFARWWIRQRTEFKPKGKRLIGMELKQKGIGQDILEKVYQDGQDDVVDVIVSDRVKAVGLLERRKDKYSAMERNELYQKAGGFLGRRGFDWEVIRQSIDEVFGK